jgi:hypothetical protein
MLAMLAANGGGLHVPEVTHDFRHIPDAPRRAQIGGWRAPMIHPIHRHIMSRLQIEEFVETGSFRGDTVAQVRAWFPDLHIRTVEIDTDRHEALLARFAGAEKLEIACDSSQRFLRRVLDDASASADRRRFFYLDAHWGEYWPLRDELGEILRLRRAVIVIDDFVVPTRPMHGFDVYKTKICGWYYIRDLFAGVDYRIYYPQRANPDGRGNVIIFVGYAACDLEFMTELACFEPTLFEGAPLLTFAVTLVMWLLVATGQYERLEKLYLARHVAPRG